MKRSAVIQVVLTVSLSVALGLGFGRIFFDDHAWGSWGDDSPGYLFLAGQMLRGEPNVYHDELAARGLDFFGDEKLARWLTPTHHQFINTRGVLASKYPVGLSLIMAATARLWHSDEVIYFVEPALAAVNMVLVFLFGLMLFRTYRYRYAVSAVAAALMGVSNVYYDYAIAQPMREIPSMTFLLIAAITLVGALRYDRRWLRLTLVAFSGAAFGMAFNIRETSLVLLPVIAVVAVWTLWKRAQPITQNLRRLWLPTAVFIAALIVASVPTIQNSISISKEKEVFKARDTSSVVVLSNIGHIQTLSPENIFNNEGKFEAGEGALPHYWDILQHAMGVPYFLFCVALGVWYYWRESRQQTALLVGWILSVLLLFSLWINPYSRYILPLYPPLFLLGVYGAARAIDTLLPHIFTSRMLARALGAVVIVTGIVAYQPVIAEVRTNLVTDVYRFKAISRDDLHALKNLADAINADADRPVLMFSGTWQYGISETLQTHTGLKTIRFPLEQRFVFDRDQVQQFFDGVVTADYQLYVWADTTSSADFYEWLAQYNTELIDERAYTFEPGVRVYRIINKK